MGTRGELPFVYSHAWRTREDMVRESSLYVEREGGSG
jgi:hypothetical protein